MPRKLTTVEFIEKAREIHGDKYDYSKVEYIDAHTKVCIICPIHREFWQLPLNHLRGKGCVGCQGDKLKKLYSLTLEEFIETAHEVHGNKYNYSKVKYINNRTKVCIICPIHGEFWQTPDSHLRGNGCKKCAIQEYITTHSKSTEQFISDARKIHCDKYDYSKVNYINAHTKVCIICPTHGEFWQTPHKHLQGNACPHCNTSNLENEIKLFLTEQNIGFEQQKKFDWLGRQSLDFYLPKYNIGIECQGMQHFKAIEHFGGKQGFIDILERDVRKKKLCEEKDLKLFYFADKVYENADYQIFIDKFELLKEIIKNGN